MRAMIMAALPVSFETQYEAISKLQKLSVAFIHLRECSVSGPIPLLFFSICSGGGIDSGECPTVHLSVDPQQPH